MSSPAPPLALLCQLVEGLSESERRALVFLCGSRDSEHSPAHARGVLEGAVSSSERPVQVVRELLVQLRRLDLLRQLCQCGRDEVERQRGAHQLSAYRVLMVNLSEDLTTEDLNQLKFLLGGVLARDRLDRAKCFLDVITELEKQDEVSSDRVDLIETCLKDINRLDLAKRVRRLTSGVPEQTPGWRQWGPPPNYLEHYKLDTNPRGMCVIIDCVGQDGALLEETFRGLHFSVALHRWLSVSDCQSALRSLQQSALLRSVSAFVCCVISRGTPFHLLATDAHCTGLHLDALRHMFTPDNCPALTGKPKLFFIQRYNVSEYEPAAGRSLGDSEDLETDGFPGQNLVPTEADVFWSHCWTPESQLQTTGHHSQYLRALMGALQPGHRRSHLVDLHLRVNAAVSDHNQRNPAAPYHLDLRHTLRKNLYLH